MQPRQPKNMVETNLSAFIYIPGISTMQSNQDVR